MNHLNGAGFFSVEVQHDFMFLRAIDKYGNEVWKQRIDRSSFQ